MALMAKKRFQESGPGGSQRQLRVGELIRRTLADALMQGAIHDTELNRLSVTVAEVKTSPDLRIATAYVMPLGGKDGDLAIAALKRNVGELRRLVGKVTKLKHTPELRFILDDTFDRMEETRRLFADENVRRDLDQDEEE